MSETEDIRFKTIAEVLDYLQLVWKVTKSSLYRHQKEGKLVPDADGSYFQKTVDRYAKAWLVQKTTGKKVNDKIDELQRRKLEKELETLDIEYESKKLRHEKEQGKYIPREQMDIELAARAGILDAGLTHLIQSHAAEWVRTVDGDTKKVGELINLMIGNKNELINNYASTRAFQVIIDADEDSDIEQSEQ